MFGVVGLAYHSALEYLSVFDEKHHIFADRSNPTKNARYDGTVTLKALYARHSGKKVQIEISRSFVPVRTSAALLACAAAISI